jgi:hypothetical protein
MTLITPLSHPLPKCRGTETPPASDVGLFTMFLVENGMTRANCLRFEMTHSG